MANQIITTSNSMTAANKDQSSQGLILQGYCNSVLQQPQVDFSGYKNLTQYQTQINNGLAAAQGHANTYLNTIQPAIITNLSNIYNYYQLNNAVPTALPPGSSMQQWMSMLGALQEQATAYQQSASSVLTQLTNFHSGLNSDTANFSTSVSNLNAAVNGDNGVLAGINDELSSIDSKIGGAIAGIVLSGIAIVGGVFIIAVGSIAGFVTAGTSTPLVIGGAAVLAAGIGGEVASALILQGLNDQKANLLTQKSTLNAEVNLATGMSTAIGSLKDKANAAVLAATQMENAWNCLSADLTNLSSDLQKGITSTDQLRTLFLTAANTITQTVIADTNTIKSQMTGVTPQIAPAGTNIGNYVVQIAQQQAA